MAVCGGLCRAGSCSQGRVAEETRGSLITNEQPLRLGRRGCVLGWWLRWLVVGGDQDRLGVSHEASLQGLVLPTRRKQRRELVLLLSHGLWPFE